MAKNDKNGHKTCICDYFWVTAWSLTGHIGLVVISIQHNIILIASRNHLEVVLRFSRILRIVDMAKTVKFIFSSNLRDSRFSFLWITRKVKGLELNVISSTEIKSTIAVILSPIFRENGRGPNGYFAVRANYVPSPNRLTIHQMTQISWDLLY